jgi:hypothetical protein
MQNHMTVMPKELSEVVKSDKFHFKLSKRYWIANMKQFYSKVRSWLGKKKLNYQLAVYGEIPFSLSLSLFIGKETLIILHIIKSKG